MKKNVEKFLSLLEKDSEFTQKVLEQERNEDVIKIAESKGIELTEEDIDSINEKLKNRSEKLIFDKIEEDTPAGQLLKKMFADDSFAEEILSQDEEEKLIAIARKEGINLSPEDIKEVNETLLEISGVSSANVKDGELTEEELENVAGGGTPSAIVAASVSVSVATTPISVAAAASATAYAAATALYTASEVLFSDSE